MHYSIDIETLGKNPGCVVTQVGIAEFDMNGIKRTMKWTLNIEQQQQRGFVIEADTLKWWSHQNRDLFEEQLSGYCSVAKFYSDLDRLMLPLRDDPTYDPTFDPKDIRVWACGTDFDMPIIKALLEKFGYKAPWPYNGVRDVRTLRKVAKASGNTFIQDKNDKPHDALSDAMAQAGDVIRACYALQVSLRDL